MMRRKWVFIVTAGIVGVAVFMAIGGAIVMRLWNWLLPPLFGWHEVTYWQALGLLVLSRILFGGLGRGSFGPRRRLRERLDRMTPEERQRVREAMLSRCGSGRSAGEARSSP